MPFWEMTVGGQSVMFKTGQSELELVPEGSFLFLLQQKPHFTTCLLSREEMKMIQIILVLKDRLFRLEISS